MVTILEYVKLRDFSAFSPEKVAYCTQDVMIEAKNGDLETVQKISFPHTVALREGAVLGINVSDGDSGDAYIQLKDNDGAIGVLGADRQAGAKSVPIYPVPTFPLYSGCVLRIGTEDHDYLIDSYDSESGEATLIDGLTEDKSSGAAIELRVYHMRDIQLVSGRFQSFGREVFGSGVISPDLAIVIRYRHVQQLTADKDIPFRLVYFYGDFE